MRLASAGIRKRYRGNVENCRGEVGTENPRVGASIDSNRLVIYEMTSLNESRGCSVC
jgi:hypothetical protein